MLNKISLRPANLVFRKIPSLGLKYEINSDGKIVRNAKSKKKVKQHITIIDGARYRYIIIGFKKVYIHELVAECWLWKKPSRHQIYHINHDTLDNHHYNLRYTDDETMMDNKMGIVLVKNGEIKEFKTSGQAIEYLIKQYPGKKRKNLKSKFAHRRHHVFDYEVEYKECFSKCND